MNEALAGNTLEQPIDLDLFDANALTQITDPDTEIATFDPDELLDETTIELTADEQAALEAERAAATKLITELYTEHFGSLMGFALHLTGNRHNAEDLMQDAYEKAFRFAHTFMPGTNGKAWLNSIVRTTFIGTYRKAQARPQIADSEINPYTTQNIHARGPEDQYIAQTAAGDAVKTAFDAITNTDHRNAFLASTLGYSGDEAAELTGMKPVTFRTASRRGRIIAQNALAALAETE